MSATSAEFNPPERIVIATRESRLALWQAEHVKARLEALYPGCRVELLGMTTRGDQILDRPLAKVGGKGLFVKELEAALLEGRADIAVHSMKDVPMQLAEPFALPCISEREVLDSQLKGLGLTFQELTERGFVNIPIEYKKYQEKGFRTPTGKIELYSTRMEQMGYAPLPYYEEPPESPLSAPEIASEYPLVLTTGGRIPFFFNSEHRQIERVRKARREPRAEIHPDTAAAMGIAEGDWMWIETRRGRMKQRAKLTTGIDPRVINAEHAWWFPEEDGPEYGVWKSNVNLLTDNQPPYDPAMGTYQLRALLCRVGKAD